MSWTNEAKFSKLKGSFNTMGPDYASIYFSKVSHLILKYNLIGWSIISAIRNDVLVSMNRRLK